MLEYFPKDNISRIIESESSPGGHMIIKTCSDDVLRNEYPCSTLNELQKESHYSLTIYDLGDRHMTFYFTGGTEGEPSFTSENAVLTFTGELEYTVSEHFIHTHDPIEMTLLTYVGQCRVVENFPFD